MWTLVLFLIGFYILIKGADILIDGATGIAERMRVSPFVIGLLIAGIGTSIPELVIMLVAHAGDQEAMGLGTVIGSNTFNILAILGASALATPLVFKRVWVSRDLLWNCLAIIIAGFFALGPSAGVISRAEGIIMLGAFVLWLAIVFHSHDMPERERHHKISIRRAAGLSVIGTAGVILGGRWVVDGAATFAALAGMSEALIGLTIVGIGTSLPEFAVSVTAAYRDRFALSVGNVVGSNIFDFLMILGVGALMGPISFDNGLTFDLMITLLAAFALLAAVRTRLTLTRGTGALFIVAYCLYVVYLVMRG
ncbi:MAG TPA: calcium/sodium antiporter [Candidatus Paceibacterota bacterium]|nr:calcium/sodium antiporter [Candidatus Paceibacterota bacterium]